MPGFNKTMIVQQLKKRSVKGFTILELTVASAVSLTVLSVSLGLMTEMRRSMLGDRTRIVANDNLRQAADFIGQDLKQAGERLEASTQLPGISIKQGASGAPSTLVIQRQLLNETLPVCQTITKNTTTTSMDVSVLNGTISGTNYGTAISNCTYSYTAPAGGEPSPTLTTLRPTANLRSWRTFRCTQTGPAASNADPCTTSTNSAKAWAYIYDPVNKKGEFFQYSSENSGNCVSPSFSTPTTTRTCQKIQLDSHTWINTYTYSSTGSAASQPQIYLLEERKYDAISDPNVANSYILQLTVNRQTQNPLRIANNISNFQVWAKVPTSYTSSPFNAPTNWGCDASGSSANAPNPTYSNQWYCHTFNVDLSNTYTNSDDSLQYINDWQDLQGVRITLTGINPNNQLLKTGNSSVNNTLSLSSEFFPRNVLSKGS
jgi:hypothetical protein